MDPKSVPSAGRSLEQRVARSRLRVGIVVAAGLALTFLLPSATVRAADEATLKIVVVDAADGKPIYQAHLTLQFKIPQKYRQEKWISYSAKTDMKGQYTFHHITKGPIRLMVTADNHQSFGKQYVIKKSDPVIEVKLRKPQPLI